LAESPKSSEVMLMGSYVNCYFDRICNIELKTEESQSCPDSQISTIRVKNRERYAQKYKYHATIS